MVPAPDCDNIKALSHKNVYIVLYSFSIRVGILCLEDPHQLRGIDGMILICVFIQILQDTERTLFVSH